MDIEELQHLQFCASTFNIDLSEKQLQGISVFLDELCQWNKKMNLTGTDSRMRIINELVLDSIISSHFVPESGKHMDLGSGAGFPAIPLKIVRPELHTLLIEANAKRVSFLKHIARLTQLKNIHIINTRIEDGHELLLHGEYHVITARAVAPLHQVIEWCSPWLSHDGVIINFQGSDYETVLKKSDSVMKKNSIVLFDSYNYKLPENNLHRNILILKKVF